MTEQGGVKHDQEKPPLNLISSRFLVGLALVLCFGARKYASHNWRKGIATSRLYSALQRHLVAWNDGEDTDKESGLPHLYHAACCLMFLAEQMEVKPELDDRYKPSAEPVKSKSVEPETSPVMCCECKVGVNPIASWVFNGQFYCFDCYTKKVNRK